MGRDCGHPTLSRGRSHGGLTLVWTLQMTMGAVDLSDKTLVCVCVCVCVCVFVCVCEIETTFLLPIHIPGTEGNEESIHFLTTSFFFSLPLSFSLSPSLHSHSHTLIVSAVFSGVAVEESGCFGEVGRSRRDSQVSGGKTSVVLLATISASPVAVCVCMCMWVCLCFMCVCVSVLCVCVCVCLS